MIEKSSLFVSGPESEVMAYGKGYADGVAYRAKSDERRERIATAALPGILMHFAMSNPGSRLIKAKIAEACFEYADAMIAHADGTGAALDGEKPEPEEVVIRMDPDAFTGLLRYTGRHTVYADRDSIVMKNWRFVKGTQHDRA